MNAEEDQSRGMDRGANTFLFSRFVRLGSALALLIMSIANMVTDVDQMLGLPWTICKGLVIVLFCITNIAPLISSD